MGSRKAETVQMVQLLHSLIDDVSHCQSPKDRDHDKRTILSRVTREGYSFLTKTLPLLGKALDRALETNQFVCPSNFKRYKRTALPSFLKGLLRSIFDWDGKLLADPEIAAITEVRQICFVLYKLTDDFSDKQLQLSIQKFKSVDSGLPDLTAISEETTLVLERASRFIETLFESINFEDLAVKHGPGIVAGGEKPHEKIIFSTHYERIHDEYPYYRHFVASPSVLGYCVSDYRNRTRQVVGTNKVLFVPKDSRGPRTIACEPLEYMWVQQGLRDRLYSHIENHPLTRGRINFSDQTINFELARRASLDMRHLATVDLKDASDSVSTNVVDTLFEKCPKLLRKLLSARTPYSVLPNGERVVLKKYAAMGSALCFPVEAIVFYAIAMACYSFFSDLKRELWVYGDDIIINSEVLPLLTRVYSDVGIKINEDKSFHQGDFRESCGGDFFRGHNVTPIRCKVITTTSASEIASVVAFSNNLFAKGFYKASHMVEQLVPIRIPYGSSDSPYLCYSTPRSRHTPSTKGRWHVEHQVLRRKVPVISGKRYFNHLEEEQHEYLRKLTLGWGEEFRSGLYAKREAVIRHRYISVHL